ncbi:MAG: nicotinate-nucleotide adenylyltransferase [Legionellales bacterium]|nr:nicotinate-nucleotide adenylyltransferase [Legionellales bacterium]
MTNFRPLEKPIGIIGGTFDPIHFGHLRTAMELLQIFDLEKIHFVPCHSPVHKGDPLASAAHRLAMLHLAVANEPRLVPDDREIARDTPSYMIDTLQSFRKAHPDRPLALIVGSDAFINLATWKNWRHLIELAHIIVAIRAGQKMLLDTEMENFLNAHHDLDYGASHEELAGKIFLQFVTPLDISSTMIRCQVGAHYSPEFLLPDSVLAYIKTHQLYE